MKQGVRAAGWWLSVVLVLVLLCGAAPAVQTSVLSQANITERTGAVVPSDVTLTDSLGRTVTFGSFLGTRPLVVSFVYLTCPMLCHLGQQDEAAAIAKSGLRLGRDFTAVTISIDPRDTPAQAAAWRAQMAGALHAPLDGFDWHYLVGDEAQVKRLAAAFGFEYAYDPSTGQYSHATALFVVTPKGRISRDLYGVGFDADVFAASVTIARREEIGSALERLILRCCRYIPSLRRHGNVVPLVTRVGGGLVLIAVGSLFGVLVRRERRRRP